MKIIFMGTPQFACPALQKVISNGDHEIVAVYTQKPKQANRGMKIIKSAIHQLADNNNLHVETPTTLKNEEEQQKFQNFNADLAIVAAYGMLLPQEILDGTKHGCINIHPSKLPRWRGAAPLQRTLISGDKETEICIMQMDKGLDTGDVLISENLPLNEDVTLGELHDKCAEIGAKLTIETIDAIQNNSLIATPQSDEGVTYANKLTKNDELINFENDKEIIHNQIRAISPYPGAYFKLSGKKYKIFRSKYRDFQNNEEQKPAGTIINDRFEIACNNGVISVLEIQKEGKKRVNIKDFLNGNKFDIGTTANQ